MTSHPVDKAHRLLAPRIAYLIGTKDTDRVPNLIPVSNVTSVSTQPQHVLVAVHKHWTTYRNLLRADGFTVSVPSLSQLEGVWKLGARYSHFSTTEPAAKLAASGLALDYDASSYGPVLTDGIGWLACRTIERTDVGGDHGIVIGAIEHVRFNPPYLASDGTPAGEIQPLMKQTGNRFTTSGPMRSIPYYGDGGAE
ncbi:MAG: flavin reductase family protein [Haloechinothrix sp.]